ncbi:MAG: DUF454 family protein [Turicibacter sp.]
MKFIYRFTLISIGSLSLAIGIIGIFLPLIPTTPLLLLSTFLFSKSSRRFHHQLTRSRVYQKYGKDFIEHRQLTHQKKVILLTFASTMLAFPFFILEGIVFKLIIILMYIFLYYYFLYCIETI